MERCENKPGRSLSMLSRETRPKEGDISLRDFNLEILPQNHKSHAQFRATHFHGHDSIADL